MLLHQQVQQSLRSTELDIEWGAIIRKNAELPVEEALVRVGIPVVLVGLALLLDLLRKSRKFPLPMPDDIVGHWRRFQGRGGLRSPAAEQHGTGTQDRGFHKFPGHRIVRRGSASRDDLYRTYLRRSS